MLQILNLDLKLIQAREIPVPFSFLAWFYTETTATASYTNHLDVLSTEAEYGSWQFIL